MVPVGSGDRNATASYEPDTIHYFPLSSNRVREIEITLRTELGNLVPFEAGKVVVTLIVRKALPFGV